MAQTDKKGSAFVDDASKLVIYEGINISQMQQMFHLDFRTVQKKVFESGVKPSGKRYGADIYAVHEIAPYLIKPVFDVETYIRRMNHNDLPKHLTKEFWAGLRSKQEYEEKAGLLWRTEKVVEHVGDLMKMIKMNALLFVDAVERQTELSDRQRDIIRNLSRGMLEDLRKRVEKHFKVPEQDGKLQEEIDDEDL